MTTFEAGSPAPDITSATNQVVVTVAKLHRGRERRRRGLTLLEGPNLLHSAIDSGNPPDVVFARPRDESTIEICLEEGITCRTVSDAVLSRIAPTDHPRGPIAVLPVPPYVPLRAADTLVLLGIADPGNAGALIRSAAAFGFRVAFGLETVDAWSPKTLRAGAGAHFLTDMSILSHRPIEELKSSGLKVIATTAVPETGTLDQTPEPIALLIGNEPRGLDPEIIERADGTVSITTGAVESLNAAVAGSILMFERNRIRFGASP